MAILLYVLIGLLGLLFLLKSKKCLDKPIPGPRGWPLVGMGLSLNPETLYESFTHYADQYGDIFKVNVFGRNLVVLNSADCLRKAFNVDPYKRLMNDRFNTFFGDYILFGSQGVAFMENAYGSIHGDLRKGPTRALHVYGEGKSEFEEKVKTEIDNLIDKIESYNGKEFEFEALVKLSLTNILSIILGGRDIRNEERTVKMFWDFDQSLDFLLNQRVNALMSTFPIIRFLPSIYKDRYDGAVNSKAAITRKYFHDVKASHDPDIIRGLVDFLIDEQLQAKESGCQVIFTDERIIALILETIAAGLLTTLATLCSIFLCLLNHPEYQRKIQAELDMVIGKDRLPTFADRQNCPVTESVIMESQRYITLAPFLLGHLCKSRIEFEGYDIEANSTIVPNVWYIHHDKKVWGDPWIFRPERWLNENGQILPNDHPLRMSWMPFGTGRRQCVGESFARSRVVLYVARLIKRWTFQMPPGTNISCDPRLGHFQFAGTCRPKPYFCTAVDRD